MNPKTNEIAAVYVHGGNVQEIRSTDPEATVLVFDVDNLREHHTIDEIDEMYENLKKKFPYSLPHIYDREPEAIHLKVQAEGTEK